MKAQWIWFGIAGSLGVGALVAAGVLGAYSYYLGPVSALATDWGSFGSVMSGAFTLLSSFATIGTLLFLYLQQVKQDERSKAQDAENQAKQLKHDQVVEKQLAALTFEQYLNHRKLFIERLNEQAIAFNNTIHFPNPEKVYNSIFTRNHPSNCEYTIDISDPSKTQPHDLSDCVYIYNKISRLLENYTDKEDHLRLIESMSHLQGCLGIMYAGPTRDGDIFFLDHNTGINIYCLSQSLFILENVLNSIIFYSGNKHVPTIHHKGQSSLIRDAIYKTLSSYHRAQGAFAIKFETLALPHLHDLYEDSQIHFNAYDRVLEETYRLLAEIFSDHREIEKLSDHAYADQLTDVFIAEIRAAQEKYKDDPDAMVILNKIDQHNWAAMEALGVTT